MYSQWWKYNSEDFLPIIFSAGETALEILFGAKHSIKDTNANDVINLLLLERIYLVILRNTIDVSTGRKKETLEEKEGRLKVKGFIISLGNKIIWKERERHLDAHLRVC